MGKGFLVINTLSRVIFILCVFSFVNASWAQNSVDLVKEVQQTLLDRGYAINIVDGKIGPNTTNAIKKFQKDHKLQITGELNSNTTKALLNSKPIADGKQNKDDEGISWWVWAWGLAGGIWYLSKSKKSKSPAPRKSSSPPNSHSQAKPKSVSRRKIYEEDDDDLTSFTIEVSFDDDRDEFYSTTRNQKSVSKADLKKQSDACWVPKGQTTTVAGITINHGLIYVGSKLSAQSTYRGQDNCLINPKLNVTKNSQNVDYDQMPYWPSYSEIPANHRRKYLEWLADGAKDPSAYIGYVFLYFYGLERRLFLDQSVEDAEDIIQEINRLLGIYGGNPSINRYLNEALSNAVLFKGESIEPPKLQIRQAYQWIFPIDIQLYIGKKLNENLTIQTDDLIRWFLAHPETHLRTPATRLEKEFIALLQIRLNQEFPQGLKVRKPKGTLSAQYSASSNSFNADLGNLMADAPDITNIMAPINKVEKVAEEVMNSLDKLSRYLGRNPGTRDSLKAATLLPAELIQQFGGAEVSELQTWLSGQTSQYNDIILLSELIVNSTESDGTKVTKTIHKEVYNLVSVLGWDMVPAPDETISPLKPHYKVLLTKKNDNTPQLERPSAAFQLFLFELALGTYIAHADTQILDIEIDKLTDKINSNSTINGLERDRLHKYVDWLKIEKVDFGALKRKLKTVDADAKEALASLAIAIAAADGRIVPEEVKALEAIYQSMSLDKQDLYSNIHNFTESSKPNKSTAQVTDQQNTPAEHSINLDMSRISETLEDTQKASSLLASIFEDDEEHVEPPVNDAEDEPEDMPDNLYAGLDNLHNQLLIELLTQNEWSRLSFEQLTSSLKLMPDGAMETINEWAFDKFDEAIIEDDDPILIYKELISEGISNE